MASRSPDSATSTLACAARNTEVSDTASSSASRRRAATRWPGIVASCSQTPARGARVHRGIDVNPPAASTPRQNSRPASAAVTVSGRLILVISRLRGRVSAPPRVLRDFLAFHEEGIRGEYRAVAHRHAVVDHCVDPDGAAGADRGPVGLESAVLL